MWEREREGETERERESVRERDRETERERQRDRERVQAKLESLLKNPLYKRSLITIIFKIFASINNYKNERKDEPVSEILAFLGGDGTGAGKKIIKTVPRSRARAGKNP